MNKARLNSILRKIEKLESDIPETWVEDYYTLYYYFNFLKDCEDSIRMLPKPYFDKLYHLAMDKDFFGLLIGRIQHAVTDTLQSLEFIHIGLIESDLLDDEFSWESLLRSNEEFKKLTLAPARQVIHSHIHQSVQSNVFFSNHFVI